MSTTLAVPLARYDERVAKEAARGAPTVPIRDAWLRVAQRAREERHRAFTVLTGECELNTQRRAEA